MGGVFGFLFIKYIFLGLGPVVYGFDAQTRMDIGISSDIEQVLTTHCNCENVQQFFLMQGFQYRKQESFGKRADFKIFNSNNKGAASEIERINSILKERVRCYEQLDLVTFEFVSNQKHHIYSIQNGTINL